MSFYCQPDKSYEFAIISGVDLMKINDDEKDSFYVNIDSNAIKL